MARPQKRTSNLISGVLGSPFRGVDEPGYGPSLIFEVVCPQVSPVEFTTARLTDGPSFFADQYTSTDRGQISPWRGLPFLRVGMYDRSMTSGPHSVLHGNITHVQQLCWRVTVPVSPRSCFCFCKHAQVFSPRDADLYHNTSAPFLFLDILLFCLCSNVAYHAVAYA